MATFRRVFSPIVVVLIVAIGLFAAVSSNPPEVDAQAPPLELNALCVNTYTGAVSVPPSITGTTCPAYHFALLIPDAFPFSLTINRYTGSVAYTKANTPPPPGFLQITLPDDGNLPLCLNLYTRQLRFSFTNACPASALAVVVVGQLTPDAVDDGPYTAVTSTTLNLPAPGLLANDDLGLPAGDIASFGISDATTTSAGNSVAFAGGTLTVNSDGSFSLVNPTIPGDYTFQYLLDNGVDVDTATVAIQVQELPDAVDDGPYTTLELTSLIVTTADPDDLLDNDTLGFPNAVIVSFGGGSLPGDATSTSAGNSAALAGGALTVNSDGSFLLLNPTTAGQYSFLYRLENEAGFDDATATIEVQRPPDAVNDSYAMTVNTTLTITTADPNDLLDNDDTGFPAGAIVSFGLGDPTTTSAGNSMAFAGGTLSVYADGSFTLANPTAVGQHSFQYRLANTAGSDDATVTIQIQGPPDAVDDGPASDSSPGDLFHTAFNTTLDSAATAADDNLLSNDDRGFPQGDLASFGGGALGGTVTDHNAGSTVTPLPGESDGSLTVNADGSFVFTPPTGFIGEYSFTYRLANGSGSDDATVTIAVGARPAAQDDTYSPTVLGNVSIDTTSSTSFSVLDNDSGDGLSFAATSLSSTQGGDVTLNPDGTFSYNPPAGYEGSDSFSYTVDNGFNDPQTGTVSLTVSGMIWFIDQSAGPGGDGRLSSPFNCLVSASCFSTLAADEAGDTIFLTSGAYTGGLTLLDNQRFIGEGATQDLPTITGLTPPADSPALPATNGFNPQITTSNADAITLGSDNTLRGFTIGNTGTGTGLTGTNFGTLTLSEVMLSGTGQALDLENGTANATFISVTANGGGSQGMRFDTISGAVAVPGGVDIDNPSGDGILINASPATFTFGGATFAVDGAGGNGINLIGANGSISFTTIDLDTITSVGLRVVNNTNPVTVTAGTIGAGNDPGGNAVDIDGGSANVSIGASVRKTTAGEVVEVTGRTGGTVTLSNTITCNSGCSGLNVSNNTSGTTSFSGSVALNTGASTAANLTANGGHTVTFSGGLDIDTTSGVGFNATGSGTVEVTGAANTVDSTAGTAVNINSATIGANGVTFRSVSANNAASGIVLNSTGGGGFTVTGVGITDGSGGTIQNITNRGVEAISTQNLSLANMNFISAGTTNGADPTNAFSNCGDVGSGTSTACNSAVHLQSATNTTLSNLSITGGAQVGISGSNVNGLSIADTSVVEVGDQPRESALKIFGLAGTVTITNSDFDGGGTAAGGPERAAWIGNTGSEVLTLTISNSTFRDTQDAQSPPGNAIGADGLEILHFGTASSTIDIINSSFLRNRTNGLQVFSQDNANVSIDITGSTFDRDIGIGIGMDLAASDNATLNFNVSGNPIINGRDGSAINVYADSSAFIQGRINNNPNIQAGGSTTSGFGISVQVNESAQGIVDIDNNTISNIGYDAGIRVIARGFFGNPCGTTCTAGRLDATISNNTVTVDINSLYDIWVQASDSNTTCANVTNNTASGNGIEAFRARTNSASSTMQLQGFTSDATTTWNNNGNTPAGSVSSSHNGTLTGGTCATPSNPAP